MAVRTHAMPAPGCASSNPCCPCLAELDVTVLLVVFLSKALVAAVCVGFGRATLGTMHGRASLSHAAMYAMAASHSFDVTLGIPLATELFPTLVAYVYANQVALASPSPSL